MRPSAQGVLDLCASGPRVDCGENVYFVEGRRSGDEDRRFRAQEMEIMDDGKEKER